MFRFQRLAELALAGQRVFIRADLNVPQNGAGHITDDTRIKASVPAIAHCVAAGAAVMVTSHWGRPAEGLLRDEDSLAPVGVRLAHYLGQPVRLIRDWLTKPFTVVPGEVVLLENCRVNPGEKRNDPVLAQKMAQLCDVYVNDAFGTAHRAEATTHGMAQYAPHVCAGPLLAAELDALGRMVGEVQRPWVAIVGGSKVSTKLTILKSLADRVDQLIVGGGIANTFMAASGLPVGRSLVEWDLLDEARAIMASMQARGAAVPLPSDVVVARALQADAQAITKLAQEVAPDEMILDIGPQTAAHLAALLTTAGTIVWNGPVGVFEFPAFAHGTEVLARAIARSPAFSIAGGGDTLAAIAQFQVADQMGYISTGGGAFLEFLEGKTLPAVAALEARAQAGAG